MHGTAAAAAWCDPQDLKAAHGKPRSKWERPRGRAAVVLLPVRTGSNPARERLEESKERSVALTVAAL